MLEVDDDETSIKDIVGHRAHWIGLFLGWYRDAVDGKSVETPAPGYKWNQLKAYNADVYAAARSKPWKAVRDALEQQHEALVSLIESLSEDQLYTPHLYDWMNDWTIGRWAEASGASHYRSAAKYIRQIQKRVTADT